MVYGSRLRGGRPQRAFLFTHLVGNRILTLVTNVLFNTTISDMETGYKAMRRDVVDGMTLRSEDFTIEPELTAKILKGGWRIYEVPIAYYGRTYAEGKKISWRHGVTALIALFRTGSADLTRGGHTHRGSRWARSSARCSSGSCCGRCRSTRSSRRSARRGPAPWRWRRC